MRRERTTALLAVAALAYALWRDNATASRVELAIALGFMSLAMVFASPRWEAWLRRPSAPSRGVSFALIAAPIVVGAAFYLGGPRSWDDMGLSGDWPVNEVFVRALRDALERGQPFTWSTQIAPGDPTLELYPTRAHRVLAHVALAFPDIALHRIVVGAAVLAFVAVAVGVARAARASGAPWAASVLVGFACLYDYGSDFGWGARATFFWGFFPSTLAMGVWFSTLPTALTAITRPRRRELSLTALGFGAAALLHPVGLVLSGALIVGALVSLPTAHGAERPRLLWFFVALAAGLALSAPWWAPASQRVLDHGVHFGTPPVPFDLAWRRMASGVLPDGSFVVLVLLGWIGVMRALAVRRAASMVIAVAALFLVSLYIETYFLDLGLAPSVASVRWQSFRVGTFLKPVLYIASAHALGLGVTLIAHTPAPRVRRAMRVAGALGVLAVWGLVPEEGRELEIGAWFDAQSAQRAADLSGHELADRDAYLQLREHLAQARATTPEGQHARLLLYCPLDCPYELMNLAWDPGVPLLLHHPAPAGHFLRDQFFDTSPENLRRFGVRWALAVERTPPPGLVETEQRFGPLVLREIEGWDGTFAHVTDGAGSVRVEVIDTAGYDLVVEGGPARVELGTPYYPRLLATHDGAPVPLAPLHVRRAAPHAVDTGERAVVLELPPGRTQVRATGPLRSDGAGRMLAVIAVLGLAGLALLTQRVRRDRRHATWWLRAQRWIASPWPLRVAALAVAVGIACVPLSDAAARGLRFGWLFSRPRMQIVVPNAPPLACESDDGGRSYRCGDVEVIMTVATILQDWHVGWPVPVPAIEVRGAPPRAELVMETDAPLAGEYLGACQACSATLERGEQRWPFAGTATRVALPSEAQGPSTLRVQLQGSVVRAALVRADLVIPPQ